MKSATVAALFLLGGCAPAAAIWLRVEAPFVVPSECDELHVRVETVEGGEVIYDRAFALPGPQQFPLTLSLYTRDSQRLAPAVLKVTATAKLRGEIAAAPATQEVTLSDGDTTPVTLQLVRP